MRAWLAQVFLTNNHLAIAMEYAAGGNLYQLVARSGGLPEPDARWYFQQLIFAIDYCHKMVRGTSRLHARRQRRIFGGERVLQLLHCTLMCPHSSQQAAAPGNFLPLDMLRRACHVTSLMYKGVRAGSGQPGCEAGEHPARQQRSAAHKAVRFWLL